VVGGPGTAFTTAKAIIYNLAGDSWRTSPPAPEGMTAAALAAGWDGRRVVVVNYDMRAAAYDPSTNQWDDLPPVPARFFESYPSVVAQSGTTMAFMAQTVAVLTPEDSWVPLPYASVPNGTPASTDSGVVFVWSLDSATDRNVLAAFDPALLAASPTSLQVGLGTVPVPPGYHLSDASIVGPATAAEGVRVELLTGSESCTVSSTYSGIDGPELDQSVPETLQNNGAPREWRRSEDEHTWQTAATDSDLFEIACDDPRVARDLARSAAFGN
jgi:hypothetical protein